MNYRTEKKLDDAMAVAQIGIMPTIGEAVASITSGVLPAAAAVGAVLGVGVACSLIGCSDVVSVAAGVASIPVLGIAHLATTRYLRGGWWFKQPALTDGGVSGGVCWDTTGVLRAKLKDETLVAEQRFADQYRVLVVRNDDPHALGTDRVMSAIAIKHGLQENEVKFVPVFEAGASAYLLPLPKAQWVTVPFDASSIKAGEPIISFGRDLRGNAITFDLRDRPHTIMCGATGSGKTEGQMVYVQSLIAAGLNPILYLLDPNDNMGVFADLCKKSGGAYITNLEEGAQLLTDLTQEPKKQAECKPNESPMDGLHAHNFIARKARMSATGAKNLWQFRKNGGAGDDSRLVVVMVDEAAAYTLSDDKKLVVANLSTIARRHRASGAALVVATQRPSVDILPGEFKANCGNIIAFGHENAVSSRVTLDSGDAAGLPGAGAFVAKFGGSGKLVFGRAAYLGD